MTEGDPSFHNVLGGNSADQLRAYISRIERLEEEIDGLNDDKRDIYKEAKSCGFDRKVMRMVVNRRRKNRTDLLEEDTMVELYEQAMTAVGPRKKIVDPLED